jgi:hypothetical protein
MSMRAVQGHASTIRSCAELRALRVSLVRHRGEMCLASRVETNAGPWNVCTITCEQALQGCLRAPYQGGDRADGLRGGLARTRGNGLAVASGPGTGGDGSGRGLRAGVLISSGIRAPRRSTRDQVCPPRRCSLSSISLGNIDPACLPSTSVSTTSILTRVYRARPVEKGAPSNRGHGAVGRVNALRPSCAGTPTEAGLALYERCLRILREVEDADHFIGPR